MRASAAKRNDALGRERQRRFTLPSEPEERRGALQSLTTQEQVEELVRANGVREQ